MRRVSVFSINFDSGLIADVFRNEMYYVYNARAKLLFRAAPAAVANTSV